MLHVCDATKILLHFLTFWDLNSEALEVHCEGAKLQMQAVVLYGV